MVCLGGLFLIEGLTTLAQMACLAPCLLDARMTEVVDAFPELERYVGRPGGCSHVHGKYLLE